MGTMGFPQEEVKKALEGQKYNEVTAVYLLLGRKPAEVRVFTAAAPDGRRICLATRRLKPGGNC